VKVSIQQLQGSVLREQRQKIRRTQRDVSAFSCVSLTHVCDVELGKTQASDQILLAMLPWYNLTLPELLREMANKSEEENESRNTESRVHDVHGQSASK
jgi:transcriptional regulator with XRE-family HTH domain